MEKSKIDVNLLINKIYAKYEVSTVKDYLNGEKIFTPYWRTLRTGGMLNPQFPGGIRHQIRLLAAEGHSFIYKKKNMIVENYHWFITEDIYE